MNIERALWQGVLFYKWRRWVGAYPPKYPLDFGGYCFVRKLKNWYNLDIKNNLLRLF